jgi:hypothetical protein
MYLPSSVVSISFPDWQMPESGNSIAAIGKRPLTVVMTDPRE